jgi:hypothetical protein
VATATITLDITTTPAEDPASVVLLSLVRVDTGDSVYVSYPQSFTDNGDGSWSHTFTYPAAGVTYAHTYRVTWDDGSHDDGAGSIYVPIANYEGDYTDANELRDFISTSGAIHYSQLESSAVEDATAMQQAIEWGEDQVDLRAGGGPYSVPLTFTGGTAAQQAQARLTLQRWATVLAAWWLHVKRPIAGVEASTFDKVKAEVLAEIEKVRDGYLTLPGLTLVITSGYNAVPSVALPDGSAVLTTDLPAVRRWGYAPYVYIP